MYTLSVRLGMTSTKTIYKKKKLSCCSDSRSYCIYYPVQLQTARSGIAIDEYLLIYSFKLKSAFTFLADCCVTGMRQNDTHTANASEEVNRKCPAGNMTVQLSTYTLMYIHT